MSRFNLPLSIPRKDLVGEFLLDWNWNDSSWNWNDWTATDVTRVATDKWYVKECWQWSNWDANITYNSITYKHSYIWIDWVFTKDSAAVTDTKLTLDDWKDYWLLRFYNRELTTNEELNLKLEWLRKLWPWLLQQYPELFKGCAWYWDFKNWELSNLIDWALATNNWATLTTDHLWITDWAYSFDDQYIEWPLISDLITTWNYYSYWWRIKVIDDTDWQIFIDDYDWDTDSKFWLWVQYRNNDWKQLSIMCRYDSDNTFEQRININLNTWIHIFVVINWNKMYVYLYWDLYWTVDIKDWNYIESAKLLFSSQHYWSNYTNKIVWWWKIWQVEIFDRVFSDNEISKLYTLTKKKYIYPNPKYTPYSLPNPKLFINWNRDWDTFFDISWNWNDWTQSGWVTDWRIWQIKWMWFDGNNTKIDVPDNLLDWMIFTVSVIISDKWDSSDSDWKIIDYRNSWKDNYFIFYHDNSDDTIQFTVDFWTSQQIKVWVVNEWYKHYVFTRDWDTFKVYKEWSIIWTYSVWTNSFTWASWMIWQESDDWCARHFNWYMSNVRIFNQALTPKQIEELYYAEKWNFIN